MKEAYDPVAAALTTIIQSIDIKDVNPEDIYLAKEYESRRSTRGGKVTGYLDRARQMVREACKVKDGKEKKAKAKVTALLGAEDKEAKEEETA